MKYIAPAVLDTVSATALIQGGKQSSNPDSNLTDMSPSSAYDADE